MSEMFRVLGLVFTVFVSFYANKYVGIEGEQMAVVLSIAAGTYVIVTEWVGNGD